MCSSDNIVQLFNTLYMGTCPWNDMEVTANSEHALLADEARVVGMRRRALLVVAPCLRNSLPSDTHLALYLMSV